MFKLFPPEKNHQYVNNIYSVYIEKESLKFKRKTLLNFIS